MLVNTITGDAWTKHVKDRDEAAKKRAEAEKNRTGPTRARTAAERRQRDAEDGVELEMRRKNAQKLIAAGAVVTVGTDNYWAAAPEFSRTPKPETQDHGIGTIIAHRGAGRTGHDADAGDRRGDRATARSHRAVRTSSGRLRPASAPISLVLDADPLADIHNLRKVSAVYRDGQSIDRERLPETRVLSRAPAPPPRSETRPPGR